MCSPYRIWKIQAVLFRGHEFYELPRSKLRGIEGPLRERFRFRHPRMFLSGVQIRIRLWRDESNLRLKHAGMTDVGSPTDLTQQAAGNEPVEIQRCQKKFTAWCNCKPRSL
jgi:hypothetical protein